MTNRSWLSEAQAILDRAIEEKLGACTSESELEEAARELDDTLGDLIPEWIDELKSSFLSGLAKDRDRHVSEVLELQNGFQQRNYERWKPAFDRLQALVTVCIEVSEAHRNEHGVSAEREENYVFFALMQLHGRALLISNEILSLLKCGFPDGALARWRSLHEINVCMSFISKHGNRVAEQYFAHFDFASLRAMKQLNEHAKRAGLKPFEKNDIQKAEKTCEILSKRFGKSLSQEFSWASDIIGKARPNLRDLEQDTGLDHWRPRSRWASQNIHAAPRLLDKMLGMTEAKENMILVGASSSGLADPISMTAISLAGATTHFLLLEKDLSRVAIAKSLEELSIDIGRIAAEISNKA